MNSFRRIEIRPAVPDDIMMIASVIVETWRTTFCGMIADQFLDALTIEQVCEALNLAPSSVSALIRRGELRSVVVGVRSRRILRADLDAYLAGLAAAS